MIGKAPLAGGRAAGGGAPGLTAPGITAPWGAGGRVSSRGDTVIVTSEPLIRFS